MAEETTTATPVSPEDEQIISTPDMHDRYQSPLRDALLLRYSI